jgi:hypothetical protein
MTLKSQLFSGDAKLQACLLHDASHVTPGAVGDHVAKIQAALAIVTGARVNAGEITAKTYGHSTALAVLAFKRARRIINFAYERQADDIVGKMTLAALDEELVKRRRPPGVLSLHPPKLQSSVGRGGANFPADVAKVSELLWNAGFRPFGSRRQIGHKLVVGGADPAPPLPIEVVTELIEEFLRSSDIPFFVPPIFQPDSAPLYALQVQFLAASGLRNVEIGPTPQMLRDKICKAALANSSGRCKQEYLTETHTGVTLPLSVKPAYDWCGVYAAWVWRQAGALVDWKNGDGGGVMREGPSQQMGASFHLRLLAPGDILVFSPGPKPTPGKTFPRNHHVIVTAVSVSSNGHRVPTLVNVVEGNATPGNPNTSEVIVTRDKPVAANAEDKDFYSVDTYRDAKIRY